MALSKQAVREQVWRAMTEARVGRFPLPLQGRIPNFEGAERAAQRLAGLEVWRQARTIKVNPDSPQRPVRQLALEASNPSQIPNYATNWCFDTASPKRYNSPVLIGS